MHLGGVEGAPPATATSAAAAAGVHGSAQWGGAAPFASAQLHAASWSVPPMPTQEGGYARDYGREGYRGEYPARGPPGGGGGPGGGGLQLAPLRSATPPARVEMERGVGKKNPLSIGNIIDDS